MSGFARTPVVAAFICPRGVFAIVGRHSGAGLEIDRVLDAPGAIETELGAADQLIAMLRTAMISRASVALSVRGFGVAHHIMQLPPATDDLLAPIIEREMRRLEPELGDCVIGWTPLASLGVGGTDAVPQRSVLAAAAPRAMVSALEQHLRTAGYRVGHITALPAAMQRLVEEFDEGGGNVAVVAPLPDGAFMGFSLVGALRIVVEPPLPKGAEHESAALAEELELGTMFVRQQFRGAQLERIALVGTRDDLADAESVLRDKLHLPTGHLGVQGLSPAAFAALGAVLDEQSARPLSLGGDSRRRLVSRSATVLQRASVAALLVLALTGAWTLIETVRTTSASSDVRAARQRIQRDSFGLAPIRATADQRRLVRDAISAARVVAEDRVALQEALAGIAGAVRRPVRLDSLRLDRSLAGWRVILGGTATGSTNAQAIQSLHDVYRELPQLVSIDSLRLEQLTYSDSGAASPGSGVVRFQFSFGARSARRD